METLTLMKMVKATALIGGFSILAIVIISIWVLLMMRLLKSNVSAKEIENANVELEAGDWLLGIIKLGGIILCPIAFYFIVKFMWVGFNLCAWLWGFRRISEIFEAFVPAILGLFFVILGFVSAIGIIRIMAKEFAIKRGNQ